MTGKQSAISNRANRAATVRERYTAPRDSYTPPLRSRLCFGMLLCAVVLCAQTPPQGPMHLSLAKAEQLAAQNNPQISSARFTAAAAHQVPNQYRANFAPNVAGMFTGVGADNGSRLA